MGLVETIKCCPYNLPYSLLLTSIFKTFGFRYDLHYAEGKV
jgi:hypothetical protein